MSWCSPFSSVVHGVCACLLFRKQLHPATASIGLLSAVGLTKRPADHARVPCWRQELTSQIGISHSSQVSEAADDRLHLFLLFAALTMKAACSTKAGSFFHLCCLSRPNRMCRFCFCVVCVIKALFPFSFSSSLVDCKGREVFQEVPAETRFLFSGVWVQPVLGLALECHASSSLVQVGSLLGSMKKLGI